nr:integrase, catalytic region, zinc finger, CCHC-type, peptidase aspartic, catalytic [Tanacetum cinerariifolium]
MDSIIPLGQKNTLAEYMILFGADNRPPMLDNDMYDSWKSRMELYMQNREHERIILESVEHVPLIWPAVEENGVTRTKKYVKLSTAKKIQADFDMKATNIILQDLGLAVPVFSLRDDPIACLNKEMDFLTVVASSRYLQGQESEYDWHSSVSGRRLATSQGGRQGQSYSGTGYKSNITSSGGNNASGQEKVVKCYNCQGEGHTARQCTQPKRPSNTAEHERIILESVEHVPLIWPAVEENGVTRTKKYVKLSTAKKIQADFDMKATNIILQGEGHTARQCTQPKRPSNTAWYKDKAMLAKAQEAGKFLDELQLTFLADPGF